MTELSLKVRELEAAGVSEEDIETFRLYADTLRDLQLASEVLDETKRPFDRFRERLVDLQDLLAKGEIGKDAFDAAKFNALPDFVKDAIESAKTPMQRFQEDLERIAEFSDQLTDSQFDAAIVSARERAGFGESKTQFAGGAEVGTQAARDAVLRFRFGRSGDDPLKGIDKTTRDQLAEARKQTAALVAISESQGETVTIPPG